MQLRALLDRPATIALLGQRGVGKTHQACALVREFIAEARPAAFLDAMGFFLRVRATYRDGSQETEEQIIDQLGRKDLLVLDELHERGDTPAEDRLLHRLINRRYENRVATVLISNQTPEEFAARVGESIVDRIHEGGAIILCDWDSLRGTEAAA